MTRDVINLKDKSSKFDDLWAPKIIAQMNDYHFKLAKFKDDFTWHSHADTDEVFLVIDGSIRIDYRDKSIVLNQGDLHVVPKGVEHKPYSENESIVMLVEPAGTVNTGDTDDDKTASNNTWI